MSKGEASARATSKGRENAAADSAEGVTPATRLPARF